MTFLNAFKVAKTWQRKVIIVSLFHNACLTKNRNWKIIDTARYFNVSIGLVSENLKLNKQFDNVSECKSRNEALMKTKNGIIK